jgi:hypothetical protein
VEPGGFGLRARWYILLNMLQIGDSKGD